MSLETQQSPKKKLNYKGGSLFAAKKTSAVTEEVAEPVEVKINPIDVEKPNLEFKNEDLVLEKENTLSEVVEDAAKPMNENKKKRESSSRNWLKAKNLRGKENIEIYTEHLRYTAEFMAGQIDEVKLHKRKINAKRSKELKAESPLTVNSIYRAAMELYLKASKDIDFENIIDEDDLINRVVDKI